MTTQHRTTTDFVMLKFPCMIALAVMTVAAGSTLAEVSKYSLDDYRTLFNLKYMLCDAVAISVIGLLFCKTRK